MTSKPQNESLRQDLVCSPGGVLQAGEVGLSTKILVDPIHPQLKNTGIPNFFFFNDECKVLT